MEEVARPKADLGEVGSREPVSHPERKSGLRKKLEGAIEEQGRRKIQLHTLSL